MFCVIHIKYIVTKNRIEVYLFLIRITSEALLIYIKLHIK